MNALSPKKGGLPRFVAESTLGRLTKWLRLAGFDTSMDRSVPDALRLTQMAREHRRIILTRTRHVFKGLGSDRAIFICDDKLEHQLRQVMQVLDLDAGDLRPMTICATCNRRLVPSAKPELRGHVPEHIWHHHSTFLSCPQCSRIYWHGTHADAIKSFMGSWFMQK